MSKSTIPIEQAVRLALEQHQSGNFGRAEALYIEILRQDPGNIDAIHLLGVLATQGGKPEVGVSFISRAISRRGEVAVFHYNLADAYVALNRREEAIASYNRALELDPEYVATYSNLSSVLIQTEQFTRAEAICRQGLALMPDNASLIHNLGSALRSQGNLAEARPLFEKAIELQPDFAEAITNLAMCLCTKGQLVEGIEQFRKAVLLRPALADVHNNLGASLLANKQYEEAIRSFQTALELRPEFPEALNNLGSALRSLGKLDQARSFFTKATTVKPEFVEAHANLGATLGDMQRNQDALESIDRAVALRDNSSRLHFLRGVLLRNLFRIDEGIAAIRRSLELDPNASDALTSLGYSLLEQGDMDGAKDALTRSAAATPDAQSHSNVLMTINYHPGYTPADLYTLHRRWSEVHELPLRNAIKPHLNDRDPHRRIRVGYVSPDFRGHSVAYFLGPILEHHDHDRFEVFGYAQVPNFDLDTYRLRSQIDQWRETASKPVDEIERMIRDDQIDILVDLAGHTGANLLPVFARKPAPVQINMIGFPSTTGLTGIDYRITDALCDPPGNSDAHNTEKLIRMPGTFWAYQPPPTDIAVGPLPADDNGYITFTSVNNFTKVTPEVQAMWARLLVAVPGSKLVIQASVMKSEVMQDRVRARFAAAGVEPDRLDFRPWTDMNGYLSLLERSDMTLDPYPFNGGTTTCHSLWMGAPVLTLTGDRHASRMGLSMMTKIGFPEFVAYSPEEYVTIGAKLAADLPRLRQVRLTMRDHLKASPLLDAAGYTRDLEEVYRDVWAKWCATGK